MSILEKLYNLQNIQGTNNKKDYLIEWCEENSKDVKLVLNFLFNPNISVNMSKKKIDKDVGTLRVEQKTIELDDKKIKSLIDFLTHNNTGTDSNIQNLQYVIYNYKYNVPEQFLKEFICKELSLGLNIKNINSIIPNCIELIEPMLAMNINNVIDKINVDDEYIFTLKLDGNRCLIDTRTIPFKAISRNGVYIEGLDDFLLELSYTLPSGYIFDGELLPSNTTNLHSKEQYSLISSIMRTKGMKDKNKITYHIFDIVDYEKTYMERRDIINSIPNTPFVNIVEVIYKGKINAQVFKLLDTVVEQGNEGLMANSLQGLYQSKRTNDILKFKKFNDIDIKCIDIEEGSKKNKGRLGAILCEYKGGIVKVGSGFTDEQRDFYFKNPNEIINKIVKIKYFEETQNKNTNELSLRFPVFMEIRNDKDDISYE